ncbi:hypothetical protein EIN_502390 [Entamoeba invadens IP1]|uniref:Uncharacterized protein n=1 Tax=Entamoeba invadens IP1 TaxID=370355 RepID=A0A0A1TX99_ENTIV|nr:hypothetical protein EIN_502390 [Entamoeba invadens IP1]ELP84106.1 hypothetical protein EIN_502390 [Entamoeba invadens IP1]|eukprot:XP_004183452.1 hypothetical protein EIN_502390 [Entamoeba invadens IP1]
MKLKQKILLIYSFVKMQRIKTIHPIVMGYVSSGRSVMIYQFCLNKFYDKIDTLTEKEFFKKVLLDRKFIPVSLFDHMTPQDPYDFVFEKIKNIDGFIIVYSITSKPSFIYACVIYEAILRNYLVESFPCVLCGTKSDLETQRSVSKEEGENIAKEWGVPFFEISTKNNVNISECFLAIINEILESKTNEELYEEIPLSETTKKRRCEIV